MCDEALPRQGMFQRTGALPPQKIKALSARHSLRRTSGGKAAENEFLFKAYSSHLIAEVLFVFPLFDSPFALSLATSFTLVTLMRIPTR